MIDANHIDEFIQRRKVYGGNEMANKKSFAGLLEKLLGVEPVKMADAAGQNNDLRFERPVTFSPTGRERRGQIDLYCRGCFILEAKQDSHKLGRENMARCASQRERETAVWCECQPF